MSIGDSFFWSLAATTAMTMVFQVSRGMGFSRLNIPLLFGAYLSANRTVANLSGVMMYLVGGWFFTWAYVWAFSVLEVDHWIAGLLLGLSHGIGLVTVLLPVLPYVHPRVATEYDSPDSERRLEPPGFLGLNYGAGTPVAALIAHALFGVVVVSGYLAG